MIPSLKDRHLGKLSAGADHRQFQPEQVRKLNYSIVSKNADVLEKRRATVSRQLGKLAGLSVFRKMMDYL